MSSTDEEYVEPLNDNKIAMQQDPYGLYLLEEIRTLLAANLLVSSRHRDDFCGYEDERTYKTSEEVIDEGVKRLDAYRNARQSKNTNTNGV